MKPVISPIDRDLLLSELNEDTFVRDTHKAHNQVYIVDAGNAPHTLQEIGRLREETFRHAGGGTGLDCDLDEFDFGDDGYSQLIVWNPVDLEIVGGYRFVKGSKVSIAADGTPHLATKHLLSYSSTFVHKYLPYTIELGRSFVQPRYQPSLQNKKGLFSLDNLWDGLGAIVVDNRDVRYFFGKVTMYPDFEPVARDMILYFMNYYFPDTDSLVEPKSLLAYKTDVHSFAKLFDKGMEYGAALTTLNQQVRARGENIPPLINSYMNLSPSMKTFGTALNDAFGNVEETGIMVTIADIYDAKKARHIDTYKDEEWALGRDGLQN